MFFRSDKLGFLTYNLLKLFVMSLIGIATSIGQSMDVPILIRSLASSIGSLNEEILSLSFDPDFLLTLDSDLSEQHKTCQIVQQYQSSWWTVKKPRNLDWADVLNISSLERCLRTHREQITGLVDTSARPGKHTTFPSPATAIESPSCNKCHEYSHILSKTLYDLVNVHNYAKLLTTCSETQWNIDMRRASTFYSLHEASVIKQTASSSSATLDVPSSVDSVRETAAKELHRLQKLPPSSHKWTWGETLSDSDILGLKRCTVSAKNQIYSGYGWSLKNGRVAGLDSPYPPMPASSEAHESISDVVPAIPDNTVHPIMEFDNIRSLVYDPLGKDQPPLSDIPSGRSPKYYNLNPRISADLTKENLLFHTLAQDSPLHGGTQDRPHVESAVITKVGIEDAWPSASESDIRVAHPTPAVGIEDAWLSASESDSKVIHPTPAVGIEDVWPSVSEGMMERLVETPAAAIEDIWRSDSEGVNEAIEDIWVSDDHETNPATLSENDIPLENPMASEDHTRSYPSSFSSTRSQLMVSPSKITIQNPRPSFPLSDAWPDLGPQETGHPNSTLETPAPIPLASFRRFNPEDFDLQDHMFEEVLSGESDSDYDEEEDN